MSSNGSGKMQKSYIYFKLARIAIFIGLSAEQLKQCFWKIIKKKLFCAYVYFLDSRGSPYARFSSFILVTKYPMGALFKNIHMSIMTQIAICNDIVLNCIAHALGGSPFPRFSSFILVTKNPLGALFKKHITVWPRWKVWL